MQQTTKIVDIPSIYSSNSSLWRATYKSSLVENHQFCTRGQWRFFTRFSKDSHLPSSCCSWSLEWPFSACSPRYLYCGSSYLLFVGTLLFQLGQCLHTSSFCLYINVFVFRLSKHVQNESFSSPGLCAHLSRASYIKPSPAISLLFWRILY